MDRSDITNQFSSSFRNSKKLYEIARSPDKLRNNLAIPLAYQKIRHWLPDILSTFIGEFAPCLASTKSGLICIAAEKSAVAL